MKTIALSLAFHILFLTAFPCCEEACGITPETEISAEAEQPTHSEDDQEPCSPFCVGACSAAYCTDHYATLMDHPSSTIHSNGTIPSLSKVAFTIWQPPKLISVHFRRS